MRVFGCAISWRCGRVVAAAMLVLSAASSSALRAGPPPPVPASAPTLASAPASSPASAPATRMPDLPLRNLRWQMLPREIVWVFTDRRGTPYVLDAQGNLGRPSQPPLVRTGAGTRWILGFDRANRFWWTDSRGVHWYDVAKGKEFRGPELVWWDYTVKPSKYIVDILFHSSGRVFFADTEGVHVFDEGAWSYQKCGSGSDPTGGGQWQNHSLKMREGPGGEVLVWSLEYNGASLYDGLWVNDGKQWFHCSLPDIGAGPACNLVPLRGGHLLVSAPLCRPELVRWKSLADLPSMQQVAVQVVKLDSEDANTRLIGRVALLQMEPEARPKIAQVGSFVKTDRGRKEVAEVLKRMPVVCNEEPPEVLEKDFGPCAVSASLPGGGWLLDFGGSYRAILPDGRIVPAPADMKTFYYGMTWQWISPAPELFCRSERSVALPGGRAMVVGTGWLTWDGKRFVTLPDAAPGSITSADAAGHVYLAVWTGSEQFRYVYTPDAPESWPLPTQRHIVYGPSCLDSQGRLWTRLDPREHPFLSRYEDGKWVDYPDPGGSRRVLETQTRDGKEVKLAWTYAPNGKDLWTSAELTGEVSPAKPDLPISRDFVFMAGAWRARHSPPAALDAQGLVMPTTRLPSLANSPSFQPLKNGAMIAWGYGQDACDRRAFYFDGKSWSAYDNMPELVRANLAQLKKQIDDKQAWRLAVDVRERVWLHPDRLRVSDGAWQRSDTYTLPIDGTGRWISSYYRSLLDCAADPPKITTARGAWPTVSVSFPWTCENNVLWHFTDGNFTQVPAPWPVRRYVTTDSVGRAWFCTDKGPAARLADGTWLRPQWQRPSKVGYVLEQSKDVFWWVDMDGIARLRLVPRADGRPEIRVDQQHDNYVFPGLNWADIGRDNALWISSYAFGKLVLYRIELPPAPTEK